MYNTRRKLFYLSFPSKKTTKVTNLILEHKLLWCSLCPRTNCGHGILTFVYQIERIIKNFPSHEFIYNLIICKHLILHNIFLDDDDAQLDCALQLLESLQVEEKPLFPILSDINLANLGRNYHNIEENYGFSDTLWLLYL